MPTGMLALLQIADGQIPVTIEDDRIMPVPFVVAGKQVFAMLNAGLSPRQA